MGHLAFLILFYSLCFVRYYKYYKIFYFQTKIVLA